MDVHRGKQMRGYLAMLVVDKRFRGKGIGGRPAALAKQPGSQHLAHGVMQPASSTTDRHTHTHTRTQTHAHAHTQSWPPGSKLAKMGIQAMIDGGAEEVALEAEVTNTGALALYRALGFIRDKRLHRWGGGGRGRLVGGPMGAGATGGGGWEWCGSGRSWSEGGVAGRIAAVDVLQLVTASTPST